MKKTYNTEILSVGTELLLGHITNTDARDISEMLSKIGVNVRYHTVVGDNPQRLRDCVEIAKRRAEFVPPEPRVKSGYLARYAAAETSADGVGGGLSTFMYLPNLNRLKADER